MPIQTPDRLIALAIEKNADIEKLERLFDLQARYNADLARRAYYDALSAFQTSAPPIPKDKQVNNRDGSLRYKYATFDGILKALREPLKANGFSWRFECAHIEECLRVTCILTHREGHSESSTVVVPSFAGQGTNAAQDEGSAMSYGKRYSFTNVTGTTADEDDDAQTAAPENLTRLIKHNAAVVYWLSSILAIKEGLSDGGDITAAAEAYAELPKPALMDLNVAPTKGGIWTTKEREQFRDKDFQAAVVEHRNGNGWYDQPENQQ